MIPTLTTARLTLRPHAVDDYRESLAMWSDPDVTQHLGSPPSTPKEAWHRLLRYAGHWSMVGYGFWVVRETATGRFVGEVGLADWKRELAHPFGDAPELGYALAPAFHGRGLATEAVTAVLAWSDAHLVGQPTWCIVARDATASLRVAQKCGYREVGVTVYGRASVLLLQREAAPGVGPARS